jgi:hypothetical protein
MDFLEKIGYTDQGKRLRKRFSHYSEWVIQSQSLIEAFPFFCCIPEQSLNMTSDHPLEHIQHFFIKIGFQVIVKICVSWGHRKNPS